MGAFRLSENDFNAVRTELKGFGLNPNEWDFAFGRGNSLQFAHLDDPNFKISVTIETPRQGLIRVARLSVISL